MNPSWRPFPEVQEQPRGNSSSESTFSRQWTLQLWTLSWTRYPKEFVTSQNLVRSPHLKGNKLSPLHCFECLLFTWWSNETPNRKQCDWEKTSRFFVKTEGQECDSIDLCIVIDSSGSIRDNNPRNNAYDNWQLLLEFVIEVGCPGVSSWNLRGNTEAYMYSLALTVPFCRPDCDCTFVCNADCESFETAVQWVFQSRAWCLALVTWEFLVSKTVHFLASAKFWEPKWKNRVPLNQGNWTISSRIVLMSPMLRIWIGRLRRGSRWLRTRRTSPCSSSPRTSGSSSISTGTCCVVFSTESARKMLHSMFATITCTERHGNHFADSNTSHVKNRSRIGCHVEASGTFSSEKSLLPKQNCYSGCCVDSSE